VVTGGASGIGRTIADAFAGVGAHVAIFDRVAAGPDGYKVDVTDESQVKAAFDEVMKRHGRVDVLFNNAGIALRRPTTELSLDDWNKVVAVNMTGVFLCAREAARHMLAGGRGGRIINTASIMGVVGGGLYPNISYQATKGAVVNMTRALAVEWARQGIRVNAIAPDVTETLQVPYSRWVGPEDQHMIPAWVPAGRFGTAADTAGVALFLASDLSSFVTGTTVHADGGTLAASGWFPTAEGGWTNRPRHP